MSAKIACQVIGFEAGNPITVSFNSMAGIDYLEQRF